MSRRSNNRRVVLSDSEPDLDDHSNNSIDEANATRRSPSHLSSNTEPSIADVLHNSNDDDSGDASDNSNDDDLDDASGTRKFDDDTPNATSHKRDPSHPNTPNRSDNHTPSPIGESKTVKRRADTVGIELHNILYPSSRNAGERPGKRQRLSRGHGRSTISYGMKHHPMDDILRPKYLANRRAKRRQAPEESSNSDEEIDEDDTNGPPSGNVTSPNIRRRRSSRNIHQNETPIYSAKWHPLDQMLRDNASSTTVSRKDDHSKKTSKKSRDSSATLKYDEDSMSVKSDLGPHQDIDKASELGFGTAPISPNRRRSARVSTSKDAPPNYDMKYHVMDSTLRPKAAAKRMKFRLNSATSTKALSKSASPAKTHTRQLAKASPKSLTGRSVHTESESNCPDLVAPAWSELQNPYLNRTSLDWIELQDLDRRIYLIQKGASLDGNTLPLDWNVVKEMLFDEGIITLDELSSREGTELLKTRYESVRLGLQNFFDGRPEPVNKMDWTLSKTERFDVYDKERGSKYWRHRKDSVVEGTKTSSNSNILEFAAERAKDMTGNKNQEATDGNSEEQDRNEAKTPQRKQHVKNERTNPNKSSLKQPLDLEVDTERTILVDRENDGELGVIVETEDDLVESMRGKHVPSSVMSDAALEELLFPVEQYLRQRSNQEVTADSVSSGSRNSEPAGLVSAHPDKTLHGHSSVTSDAEAMDLSTSSNRRLAKPILLGKEETTFGANVGPHDGFGEPHTPKAEVKTRKRKSRVDVAIAIHEDLPGRTPLLMKTVGLNPASPGTDIPKENLEDDGSVEHSSQLEIGTPRTRRHHEAIGTPSIRRIRRLGSTTSATPPYRSLFGGPLGSSSPSSSPTTR